MRPDGRLERSTALDPILAKVDLGYYEALQVVPRASGGEWITGRFPSRSDAHHRPQIYAIALTRAGALDHAFVDPLLAAAKADAERVEIRLAAAGPGDTLVCVGEWSHPPRNPHVFRLTRAGAIDPTFHPFAMPGTYPQGRFLFAGGPRRRRRGQLAPLVWHPPREGSSAGGARPGPARTGWHARPGSRGATRAGPSRLDLGDEDGGRGPAPPGGPGARTRYLLAGYFDHLGAQPATSPLLLREDGSADPLFHPHFATELPPPEPPASAKTSDYVPADGKPHYLACRKAGAPRATTYVYELGVDPWGHQPSCLIHYAGDVLSPGGGWQDCDLPGVPGQAGGGHVQRSGGQPRPGPLKLAGSALSRS